MLFHTLSYFLRVNFENHVNINDIYVHSSLPCNRQVDIDVNKDDIHDITPCNNIDVNTNDEHDRKNTEDNTNDMSVDYTDTHVTTPTRTHSGSTKPQTSGAGRALARASRHVDWNSLVQLGGDVLGLLDLLSLVVVDMRVEAVRGVAEARRPRCTSCSS